MRYFGTVTAILFFFAFGSSFASAGLPFQDESEVADAKNGKILAGIEACGGRVVAISQAGPETEISFYLVGDKVADQQLKGISSVPNVVWLNLAKTKVTDQGLKQLSGMKLKKLHLENTSIGDAGLANIKDQVNLEYLNLYGTKVTDAGLEHLQEMTKLKRLYVWQTKVTDAGIKSIRDRLPGLEVIGECKLPVVPEKKEEPKKDEPKKVEPAPEGTETDSDKNVEPSEKKK